MSNPIVSIITPCYNQGPFLAEALESVLAQTFSLWECLIINDGSTDNTEEVALKYTMKDSRFIYIHQENLGVIAARNNGIRKSRGKYILPLDGDDKITNKYLEKAIEVLEHNDDVKIVYGDVEVFGASQGEYKLEPYSIRTLLVMNCISNSSFFRRTDFDRCGGYNPNMDGGYEDWDFWISLLEEGGLVYKIDIVGHLYRIHQRSRNVEALTKSSILTEHIWMNHLPLYQQEYVNLWKEYTEITNSRLFFIFKFLRTIKKRIWKVFQ